MSIAVVKYGGSSQMSIDDLVAHAETTRDLLKEHDKVITVVSGPGDITDRVREAIRVQEGGLECTALTQPETVFEPWEKLFREFGGPKLFWHLRRTIYREYSELLGEDLLKAKKEKGHKHEYGIKAKLHSFPEQLQAELVNYVYREAELDSLCVNFDDERFPLAVSGFYLSANVNLKATLDNSQSMLGSVRNRSIIVPGYCGKDGGVIKTLGPGGSDNSMLAILYGTQADVGYIFTDVDGMKQAVCNGIETETVPEIRIDEAEDGAFYGAKLPSEDSLEPLRKRPRPVYIAHHLHPEGKRTRIVESSAQYNPERVVKFIGSRGNIIVYSLSGDVSKLPHIFDEEGIEYCFPGLRRRKTLLILNHKGREIGESTVERLAERGDITIHKKLEDAALVGVVGDGMDSATGIGRRMYETLENNGISAPLTLDPAFSSMGAVIESRYRERAVKALYEEFFVRKGVSVAV